MATEQKKDDEMSTKKKQKLRVVNPKDTAPAQPFLDPATKKQIFIGFLTTAAVVGGIKLVEWAYSTYATGKKPEEKKEQAPNPMLPGATTPPTFQSPYSQMMRPLPMPMQPMQMMQQNPMQAMQPPTEMAQDSEPPKWFSEYAEMMDKRMAKVEKKKSKPLRKKIEDYDEE